MDVLPRLKLVNALTAVKHSRISKLCYLKTKAFVARKPDQDLNLNRWSISGLEPESSVTVLSHTTKLRVQLWDTLSMIFHVRKLRESLAGFSQLRIELGASKIVCLYGMFDSHRQVFTTVYGATWLVAIGKCVCRVNVTFMVLFMRGCRIRRGPLR
jgi:hypothetical protein